MTKARFRIHQAKSALAEVSLSPTQIEVGQLGAAEIGLVYGAPGSGKTLAIQARVSKLVAGGISADQILVFSATRESATALRDLIALDLQTATAGPLARTINSFAFSLLSQAAMSSGQVAPELISGAEQDQILAQMLESIDLSAAWPAHLDKNAIALSGFRAELRDLISVCIEHGLGATELEALSIKHSRPEWAAAAIVLKGYLDLLDSVEYVGRFDSSSLLTRATALLQVSGADLKLTSVLVDDAHELTPAASKFLQALVDASGAGLVLVGDPDSVTLSFRAADPTGMRDLAEGVATSRGQKVRQIDLMPTHAVRSPQLGQVLSRVTRQISVAKAGRQRKGVNPPAQILEAVADLNAVEGKIFAQPQDEISWVARRIRELHLLDGVAYSDIAVVVRSREALAQWSADLAHQKVAVSTAGNTVALRDEFASRALLDLSKLVLTSIQAGDRPVMAVGEAIELLTSPFCGLDSVSIRRLRRALRREELAGDGQRNSDELLVDLFASAGAAVAINSAEGRTVAAFLKSIDQARALFDESRDKKGSIEDLFWLLWSNSGLASKWQELSRSISDVSLQANRNLDSIVALFAAANRFAERYPDGDPAVFVDQQLALRVAEDTLAIRSNLIDAIAVVTPAGLIGRRFEAVVLPSLIEGAWPNLRARSSLLGAKSLDEMLSGRTDRPDSTARSELPDELRMLHKAVGAAGKKLLISSVQLEDKQISQFVNLMLGEIPELSREPQAQFSLRSITAGQRQRLARAIKANDKSQAEAAALNLLQLSSAGAPGAHPSTWYGLAAVSSNEPLVDLDVEKLVTISPSRLESFIKCPLHWFLDAHGANEGTFSASLGTLMHSAIENLVEGEAVDETVLWQSVESSWHTLSFEAQWLEQAATRKAKQMIANIAQYLRGFARDGGRVIGREVGFSFKHGQAEIKGKIDRVELLPDGRLIVVDLKTGQKQYSANDAIHHSQLGLYQLAFEAGALDQQISAALGSEGPERLISGGAKLVLVGKDKLVEREQPPLAEAGLTNEFIEQISTATSGMADQVFIAQIDTHCHNESEYGSCKIHLVRSVSYVE